jgi:quinol monooxygenase YgiN
MKASTSLKLAAALAAAISGSVAASPAPAVTADTPIVELRQYRIVAGQRDAFVDLFEREFIDSQEADGMALLGQFRDLDDPNRFVWIRSFPDMEARLKSLNAFYFGPVWKKHREAANPMLDDNDNVLLLKASGQGRGFARPPKPRAPAGRRGPSVVTATIYHLWKNPDEGFSAFFDAKVRPTLEAAGIPVLASFTPHAVENNFPRLPVRTGEKLFVWFSHF